MDESSERSECSSRLVALVHEHREFAVGVNANFDGRTEVQAGVRFFDFLEHGFDVEVLRFAIEDLSREARPCFIGKLRDRLLDGLRPLAARMRENSIAFLIPEEVRAEGESVCHAIRMPEARWSYNTVSMTLRKVRKRGRLTA